MCAERQVVLGSRPFLVQEPRQALHTLGKHVDPLTDVGELQTVSLVFVLSPARAQRRLGAPIREVVNGGDGVGEHRGVPISHRVHQLVRARSPRPEQRGWRLTRTTRGRCRPGSDRSDPTRTSIRTQRLHSSPITPVRPPLASLPFPRGPRTESSLVTCSDGKARPQETANRRQRAA
jgi:hypothetical protein